MSFLFLYYYLTYKQLFYYKVVIIFIYLILHVIKENKYK